jgi:hypothetical protein
MTFKSICTIVIILTYIILIIHNIKIRGVNSILASGSIGNSQRIIRYRANLSTKPANRILPLRGLSECTTGNQICTGHKGVLTIIAINVPNHSNNCISIDNMILLLTI